MAYPANVSTVAVTGTWVPSSGSGVVPKGTVTFRPNVQLKDPGTNQIIEIDPLVATLSSGGSISVTLMATDDPDLAPAGWAYLITEEIQGNPPLSYLMQFPASQPAVDLSTKTPVQYPPVTVQYALAAAAGAPFGLATLDALGQVPLAQLGNAPGGGGGPANSVTDETGFAAAKTAGIASTFSRGDHSHGSMAAGVVSAQTAYGLAASNGAAVTAARSDHVHGTPAIPMIDILPGDAGFLAWAYPPEDGAAGTAPASGVLQVVKLFIRAPITITNLHFITTSAGTVATNVGVMLADSAGNKLSDGSIAPATWNTPGLQTGVLAAAQAVPVGVAYGCFWVNGATSAAVLRRANASAGATNAGQNPLRYATGATGLTNVAPAAIGVLTGLTVATWCGVS